MSRYLDLAGQTLIVGFTGREAPSDLLEASDRGALAGYVLFKRNLGTLAEVTALNATLRGPVDAPMIVAVDQEGGRVARLSAPVLKLPPMRALARTGDVQLVVDAATLLGRQLRALGFTMDFAPVLDVDTNPANPIIGDRAFGDRPEDVIRMALAFADGLEQAGVASCGKHFPGHGDTSQDSHLDLPRLPHRRSRLDAVELLPFAAARGRVPAIMSAHVVFEAIDSNAPATLVRAVMTDLLRSELGYEGLAISDDLEMKAVADHVGAEQGAVRAIEAGCDALLVCSDVPLALRIRARLAAEAEADARFRARLEEAVSRGLVLRRRYGARPALDHDPFDATTTATMEARIAARLAENAP